MSSSILDLQPFSPCAQQPKNYPERLARAQELKDEQARFREVVLHSMASIAHVPWSAQFAFASGVNQFGDVGGIDRSLFFSSTTGAGGIDPRRPPSSSTQGQPQWSSSSFRFWMLRRASFQRLFDSVRCALLDVPAFV